MFLLHVVSIMYNVVHLSLRIRFLFKNRIISKGVFLKNTKFWIKGTANLIIIHPESRLSSCLFHINGNNCKILIGKHCVLLKSEFWIEDDFSTISLGGFTTIEGAHIAATEGKSIIIGEDCMLAQSIQIRNGDSHPIYEQRTDRLLNAAKDVHLGNHVWLGYGVTILKGCSIGDNSIIGSGSVVTSNVEPDSIYVGSPAKKVKDSIYWKRHREYSRVN